MEEIFLTNSQACRLWAVSRNALSEWVQKGFPIAGRSKYPLFAGADWVRKSIERESPSLTEAKLRLLTAQIERRERENLVASGLYVERSKIRDEFLGRLQHIHDGLRWLHHRLMQQLEGLDFWDANEKVKEVCYELLALYAGGGKIGGEKYEVPKELFKEFRKTFIKPRPGTEGPKAKGEEDEKKKPMVERGTGGVETTRTQTPESIKEAGGQAPQESTKIIAEAVKPIFDFPKSAVKNFYNFSEEVFTLAAREAIRQGVIFRKDKGGLPETNKMSFEKFWSEFLPGRSHVEKVSNLERYR